MVQVAASESQRQQELDLMMEELQALTREKDHADAAQEAEMAELQVGPGVVQPSFFEFD